MKRQTFFPLGVLITVLLALAACRPGGPVDTTTSVSTQATENTAASPIRSETYTPTRRPTHTHQLTATPILTSSSRPPSTVPTYTKSNSLPVPEEICLHQEDYTIPSPEQASSAYHLKNSSETAALALIAELDRLLPPCSESWSGPMGMNRVQNERRAAVKLAIEETLARYPKILEREEIEWRLALTNAWLEISTSDEWLLKAIEKALNEGKTTPETLPEYLDERGFWVPKLQYYPDTSQWGWGWGGYVTWAWDEAEPNILTMFPVPNLYGDGRTAQLFWVTTRYGGGGLFVALSQNSQNRYQLRLIQSYWELLAPIYDQFMIADHSQDGIPEILLPVGFRNGSRCNIKIQLYQWRNAHFENLMGNSLVFTNLCVLEEVLRFEKSAGQKYEHISAGIDMGLSHYYAWNGQFYYLERVENTQFFGLSEPYQKIAAEIRQQLTAGQYISATQKIEQSLPEMTDSTTESDRTGVDYLRFQLGLGYALAGEVNMARQAIQDLLNTPFALQSAAVVRASNTFFDSYPPEASPVDLYLACQAAASSIAKSIQPYRGEDGSVPMDSQLLALGYQAYPPLCDVDLVLPILARSMASEQQSDLPAALRAAGVKVEYSDHLDLDGDSDKDWLMLINKPLDVEGDAFTAWAFLQDRQSSMTILKILGTTQGLPGPKVFEAHHFYQPIGEAPITLLRSGSNIIAFQVFSGPIGSFISTIRMWSKVTAFEINPGESLNKIQIWFTPDEYRPDWEIFGWHEGWQTFITIQSKPSSAQIAQYGPIEAAQLADETLTVKWQPNEAIPLLQAALALPQAPDEGAWNCNWINSYCVDRSRLTYLLALAYELTSDEAAAVQTYWQLWHDFPHSPYALMARAKLEER